MRYTAYRWLFLLLGPVLGFAGLRLLSFLYTDWLWFDHLGYGSVFRTMALAKFLSFGLFWIVFSLMAGGNLWIARSLGRRTRETPLQVVVGNAVPVLQDQVRSKKLIWGLITAGVGLFMGIIAISIWTPALRFLNAVDFGVSEPIFGREIGFYVFDLPLYNFIQGWLIASILMTSALVVISYYQDRSIRNDRGVWFATPYVRAHLSVLGAAFALLLAWGYWLKELRASLFLQKRRLLRRGIYRRSRANLRLPPDVGPFHPARGTPHLQRSPPQMATRLPGRGRLLGGIGNLFLVGPHAVRAVHR